MATRLQVEGVRSARPLEDPARTATVTITEFSDPACPWAWSAEPARRRLAWLYGEALDWRLRMVVLSESPDDYVERGLTPEFLAEGAKYIAHEHRMPIDTRVRPRMVATLPACRAVVAARAYAPHLARRLFRELQVENFSGHLLDDPATIERAAHAAGIDPDELSEWERDPVVLEQLEEDVRLARRPSPAARALDHKLADANGARRYTCPSLEFERRSLGLRRAAPGFQPFAAYEVAVANLAPELERRPAPESVEEVLRWAGEPLATQEVAEVCGIGFEEAREELGRIAWQRPMGADGLWSLTGAD